ncbi:hypothetical protein JTB14_008544 [Gonioctena quinquepunctata]|nr:hypothetical protein JTB14_008544 [Gonioctena quinquepunctata]
MIEVSNEEYHVSTRFHSLRTLSLHNNFKDVDLCLNPERAILTETTMDFTKKFHDLYESLLVVMHQSPYIKNGGAKIPYADIDVVSE